MNPRRPTKTSAMKHRQTDPTTGATAPKTMTHAAGSRTSASGRACAIRVNVNPDTPEARPFAGIFSHAKPLGVWIGSFSYPSGGVSGLFVRSCDVHNQRALEAAQFLNARGFAVGYHHCENMTSLVSYLESIGEIK